MEKGMEFEQKTLINMELRQGKELANQLKHHLEGTQKTGETCEILVEKILSSYEKALSVLKNSSALILEDQLVTSRLDSPHSFTTDSPGSEISDQSNKNVFKKRKAMQQWSEKVQVSLGTGVEGPPSDGFSWRKYGQKEILGAKFPRAYYRCTHRPQQGCSATKQVQKSDEDPSLFEVTYRGKHTCNQTTGLISLGKERKKQKNESYQPKEERVFHFGTGLKTEELNNPMAVERLPSFSFPSTRIEAENVENNFFPEILRENNFMGTSYSPSFMTPEISGSNYFFGLAQNLQSSESDLTEILSAPNSVTNSPMGDLDISLEQVEFDPNFPFDILEF